MEPDHFAFTPTRLSGRNRIARIVWHMVWLLFYRPSPTVLHAWRRLLLRMFGANVGRGAHPYPSSKVWAPWNLEMGPYSCLASDVDCYCVAKVSLGAFATVSQYSYLCTASHDFRSAGHALVSAPIVIGPHAWVAAGAFIGPGVEIGEGAVVGARSSAFRHVEPWTVVAGTPARRIGDRPRSAGQRLDA